MRIASRLELAASNAPAAVCRRARGRRVWPSRAARGGTLRNATRVASSRRSWPRAAGCARPDRRRASRWCAPSPATILCSSASARGVRATAAPPWTPRPLTSASEPITSTTKWTSSRPAPMFIGEVRRATNTCRREMPLTTQLRRSSGGIADSQRNAPRTHCSASHVDSAPTLSAPTVTHWRRCRRLGTAARARVCAQRLARRRRRRRRHTRVDGESACARAP